MKNFPGKKSEENFVGRPWRIYEESLEKESMEEVPESSPVQITKKIHGAILKGINKRFSRKNPGKIFQREK